MAAIEGTEAAVVTASGMAAISSTLLALLRPGDHIIIQVSCVICRYWTAVGTKGVSRPMGQ